MPKILTVDDSRAVRMIVSRHASQMGFEVDEAEDGAQGLLKLEDEAFDLVVLDVTMPVLDGPGMLAKMREGGNQTPVLMLTSESKRSIVAGLMKLGISDYILKPFKPEELTAKMLKVLKLDQPPVASAAPASDSPIARDTAPVASHSAESSRPEAGKQFADIFVVDDMENVHKRLRTLLPPHLTIAAAQNGANALAACRERVFRVVLVDSDMPEVNSVALMRQMRLVQPHASFVLLALRSAGDVQAEARSQGFDGAMFKPFNEEGIEDFLMRFFDNQELVTLTENTMKMAAFKGKENRLQNYFTQVGTLAGKNLDDLAAACFAEAVMDISLLPPVNERVVRLVMDLAEHAKRVGVELRLVAGTELGRILSTYEETASLGLFPTVPEAQASVA
jgi:two-component system, cell cycle response regulator